MPTTAEQELSLIRQEVKRLALSHPNQARQLYFLASVKAPKLAAILRRWLTEEDD